MIKRISVSLIAVFSFSMIAAQQKGSTPTTLRHGMKITSSQKIKKSIYKIDGESDSSFVILIEGNNITIDFNNAEMVGSNTGKNPDEFFGMAILVRNSRHVTIRNLKARGYKIALKAENVDQLTVEDCNFSYNYRQHLASTPIKENEGDWMSYHQNEKDEWLHYGAGIYLRNCNDDTIRNCTITGGQNGLMMANCSGGLIVSNDFSFNSGIGIGMYRCNKNNVLYNRLIFNVRGYSHGIYSRGQDSAGILVYEQSNNNVFYKNNATHSGDGFFLWAGQSTMDTGEGGCNDNMIADNDFSYAPANGIEVTFSRNMIFNNRMYECDHGIWGGYSYGSIIRYNKFRNNKIGIAIEHGQENKIAFNIFYKDKEGIRLWGKSEQPGDWGYVKNRDTKSRDYTIISNSFNGNELALNFSRTDKLEVFSNSFSGVEEDYRIDSAVTGMDTTFKDGPGQELDTDIQLKLPQINLPRDPFKDAGMLAGRKNILITEWGPYDFRSPIIWQTNPTDTAGLLHFDLLGPKGNWVVKSYRGVEELSLKKGGLPATLTAKKAAGTADAIYIELEYIGGAITTPAGEVIPAGKPYRFIFTGAGVKTMVWAPVRQTGGKSLAIAL